MAKSSVIINTDDFTKIYKINLLNIPNQTFTTTINNINYTITIETSVSLASYITIKKGDEVLCCNGNIKDMLDLTLTYDAGSFFFMVDIDKEYMTLNYETFELGLYLYYGAF